LVLVGGRIVIVGGDFEGDESAFRTDPLGLAVSATATALRPLVAENYLLADGKTMSVAEIRLDRVTVSREWVNVVGHGSRSLRSD
jgi:histidine ammonia-lyase